MAKNEVTPQEAAIGEAITKTESFFENNNKGVIWALVAIFVLAGAIFGYRKLVAEPRVEKASAMIAGAGFLEIIETYGSTPAGNLAKHYAGVCYLHLGDLDAAADYLAKYSPVKGLPGQIVNAQNLGLQGDIAVEQDDLAKAVKFYDKAVKASDNIYTAPLYLRKAGLALRAQGKEKEAVAAFEKILALYPSSIEAREAEKLIGSENR